MTSASGVLDAAFEGWPAHMPATPAVPQVACVSASAKTPMADVCFERALGAPHSHPGTWPSETSSGL